jgi:hypothetical protein
MAARISQPRNFRESGVVVLVGLFRLDIGGVWVGALAKILYNLQLYIIIFNYSSLLYISRLNNTMNFVLVLWWLDISV